MTSLAAQRVRDRTKTAGAGECNLLAPPRPRSHEHLRTRFGPRETIAGKQQRLRSEFAWNSGNLRCVSRLGTRGLPTDQLIHCLRKQSCFCGHRFVRSRTSDRAIRDSLTCDYGRNVVRTRTGKIGKSLDSRESFKRAAGLTSLTQYNQSNAAWRRGVRFKWERRKKGRAGGCQAVNDATRPITRTTANFTT